MKIYDPSKTIQALSNSSNNDRKIYYESTQNNTQGHIEFKLKYAKSILNFRNLKYTNSNQPLQAFYDENQTQTKIDVDKSKVIPNYTNSLDTSNPTNFKFKPTLEDTSRPSGFLNQQNSNGLGSSPVFIQEIKRDNDYATLKFQIGNQDDDTILSKVISLDLENFKVAGEGVLFAKNSENNWNQYQTQFTTGYTLKNNWFGSLNSDPKNSNANWVDGNTWKQDSNYLGLVPLYNQQALNDNKKFGIKSVEYIKDSGDFKVVYNRDPNYLVQTSFPAAVYAVFVNNKGQLYFFGNKRGEPLNYVTDFDYSKNAMWFNLHSEQIPYDQRPKYGEKLAFVGVVVLPYVQEGQGKVEAKNNNADNRIIKFKTAAGDAEIDFAFMYPTMWYDTKDNYKVIEYKK